MQGSHFLPNEDMDAPTLIGRSVADKRPQAPLDDDYAAALGRALFTFANLQWMVVWWGERLEPGFIDKSRTMTAGAIGEAFESLVLSIPNSSLKLQLRPYAQIFKALAELRDGILHAKPVPTAEGQRLWHLGKPWNLADLRAAAVRFVECETMLNALLHREVLRSLPPVRSTRLRNHGRECHR